jgi:hypothetical protein
MNLISIQILLILFLANGLASVLSLIGSRKHKVKSPFITRNLPEYILPLILILSVPVGFVSVLITIFSLLTFLTIPYAFIFGSIFLITAYLGTHLLYNKDQSIRLIGLFLSSVGTLLIASQIGLCIILRLDSHTTSFIQTPVIIPLYIISISIIFILILLLNKTPHFKKNLSILFGLVFLTIILVSQLNKFWIPLNTSFAEELSIPLFLLLILISFYWYINYKVRKSTLTENIQTKVLLVFKSISTSLLIVYLNVLIIMSL